MKEKPELQARHAPEPDFREPALARLLQEIRAWRDGEIGPQRSAYGAPLPGTARSVT